MVENEQLGELNSRLTVAVDERISMQEMRSKLKGNVMQLTKEVMALKTRVVENEKKLAMLEFQTDHNLGRMECLDAAKKVDSEMRELACKKEVLSTCLETAHAKCDFIRTSLHGLRGKLKRHCDLDEEALEECGRLQDVLHGLEQKRLVLMSVQVANVPVKKGTDKAELEECVNTIEMLQRSLEECNKRIDRAQSTRVVSEEFLNNATSACNEYMLKLTEIEGVAYLKSDTRDDTKYVQEKIDQKKEKRRRIVATKDGLRRDKVRLEQMFHLEEKKLNSLKALILDHQKEYQKVLRTEETHLSAKTHEVRVLS